MLAQYFLATRSGVTRPGDIAESLQRLAEPAYQQKDYCLMTSLRDQDITVTAMVVTEIVSKLPMIRRQIRVK
jgi:hypothetical protein